MLSNRVKKEFYIYKCLREIHRLNQASLIDKNLDEILLILNTPGSLEHFLVHTDPNILQYTFDRLIEYTSRNLERGSIEFGYKLGRDDLLSFYVNEPRSRDQIPRYFDNEIEAETGLTSEIDDRLKPLGGKIWVAKSNHLGRTFWFTLEVRPPVANHPEVNAGPVSLAYPDWSDKIIFIVDDVKTNLILLETFLTSSGATIISVDNGLKAVNAVKKNDAIDFVLMDVRMPVLDGYEATRRIKLVKPWLPVVAISAYPASAESEKWQKAGCDAFLGKPLNFSKLLEVMESLFQTVPARV